MKWPRTQKKLLIRLTPQSPPRGLSLRRRRIKNPRPANNDLQHGNHRHGEENPRHTTQLIPRQLAGKAQAKYGDSVEQVAETARNNPLGALLIALGVGFLLGKLM